jgi:hypothetical protein
MKTFLFILTAYVALMRGVCDADPSAPASEQSHSGSSDTAAVKNPDDAKHAVSIDGEKHQMEGKPLDGKQDDHRASDKKGPGAQASAMQTKAQQASNLQARPDETSAYHNLPGNTFGNAINFKQPGRPLVVANGGLLKMDANGHLPAKSTALIPLGGPFLSNTRNRDSSLAVISGATNPSRSTAAINGTGMNRKP